MKKKNKVSDVPIFSIRYGYERHPREIFIKDKIPFPLLNRLWNFFYTDIYNSSSCSPSYIPLLNYLWTDFYKLPITAFKQDELLLLTDKHPNELRQIEEKFYESKWYKVYNFFEFILKNCRFTAKDKKTLTTTMNKILEDEGACYRVIEDLIFELTNEEEIKEIEKATLSPLEPVRIHLKRAMELMSDKINPDYRNSIKESISAVEIVCRKIANDDNATLGEALKTIEREGDIKFHKAELRAFSNLYGWTSDEEGVRHSIRNAPTLSFEDARFILIACSAFINLLIEKGVKAGIKIQ